MSMSKPRKRTETSKPQIKQRVKRRLARKVDEKQATTARPKQVGGTKVSSEIAAPRAGSREREKPPQAMPSKRTVVKTKRETTTVRPARKSVAAEPLNYIVQGMEKWWKDYVTSLDRFLQSASGRNVHDLRVAIRRLSTAFDLIDRFNPDNMVRRARGMLKDELSALSSLRDAHVEMVRMRGFLKELPEMKPFYDELTDKEAQQLKAVKKVSWKQDRKFVEVSYNRAVLRLNARRATSSGENTRRIIEASMDVLLDNLSKKLDKITQSNYASIHRVRLAFRPLRYTLEMVQPLLGLDRKQLRNAALLARLMGRIQDLDVLMKDLIESDWRKERGLAAVVEIWLSLERQKLEATQRFFRAVPKFSTLWKPIIHEQAGAVPIRSQTLKTKRPPGLRTRRASS